MELEIDKADNPVSVPAASSTQHEIDILENDLVSRLSLVQATRLTRSRYRRPNDQKSSRYSDSDWNYRL